MQLKRQDEDIDLNEQQGSKEGQEVEGEQDTDDICDEEYGEDFEIEG